MALQVGTDVFARFEICPQQHSQRILPMVKDVCTEAKIALQQVDTIGFGQGPGSFTGVRIAMATVQGLAFALETPVVGVSTLAAMAYESLSLQNIDGACAYVAIDARMNEVYFAAYQWQQGAMYPCHKEEVLAPHIAAERVTRMVAENTLSPATAAGTGWDAYAELTALYEHTVKVPSITLPNAKFMLPFVANAVEQGQACSIMDVEAVYLRDTVTWKKLPGRE